MVGRGEKSSGIYVGKEGRDEDWGNCPGINSSTSSKKEGGETRENNNNRKRKDETVGKNRVRRRGLIAREDRDYHIPHPEGRGTT